MNKFLISIIIIFVGCESAITESKIYSRNATMYCSTGDNRNLPQCKCIIKSDQGELLPPKNLPDDFKVHGLRVRIKILETDEISPCFPDGELPVVDILSIEEL